MAGRTAKFILRNRDGVPKGSLVITADGAHDGLVTYRPYRSHDTYTLSLHETAQLVMDRAAKQEAAAKGIPIPQPRRGR